jgi:hypothetical protein
VIRATGLLAWYLLAVEVTLGMMIRGGVVRVTHPYAKKMAGHQFAGVALLGAVGLHITFILNQHYNGWTTRDVDSFSLTGPLSRDLGVATAYCLIVVMVLVVVKGRIPPRLWHATHRVIPFVVLVLGTAHACLAGGIGTGTEIPVVVPGVIALTLIASVGIVRHDAKSRRHAQRPEQYPRRMPWLDVFTPTRGKHHTYPSREQHLRRLVMLAAILVALAALAAGVFIAHEDPAMYRGTGLRTPTTVPRPVAMPAPSSTTTPTTVPTSSTPSTVRPAPRAQPTTTVHQSVTAPPFIPPTVVPATTTTEAARSTPTTAAPVPAPTTTLAPPPVTTSPPTTTTTTVPVTTTTCGPWWFC